MPDNVFKPRPRPPCGHERRAYYATSPATAPGVASIIDGTYAAAPSASYASLRRRTMTTAVTNCRMEQRTD